MNLTTNHVPASIKPFVGRTAELAEITRALTNPDCRLLTLVGPGGVGKTRLAQEAARRAVSLFADGVYFVGLQALSTPDFIVPAIADALELDLNHCCEPLEQLADHLRGQTVLLVLDNFEHLLAGAHTVSALLAAAPGVRTLATSREKLNLQGEWVWPVNGLRFPTNGGGDLHPADYGALALFEASARRVRADFSLDDELDGAVQICTLVDGMPLAIEFAAAWVSTLSTDEIAAEIRRSINFLSTRAQDIEQRHTSMRAVLDYSWDLLTPAEQDVFKRLAVFRGSFTRQAAADVANATLDDLSSLIDKSLVRRDEAGRYDIHELVRQYAEQHLNAGPDDSSDARDRHARYYLGLLHHVHGDLFGSHPQRAMRTIEREIKNIRVAWAWASIQQLAAPLEAALESLWFFYDTRSWYREGEKMLNLAVDGLRGDPAYRALYGKLVTRQAVLSSSLNWFEQAAAQFEEGLAIAYEIEDTAEIAFALVRRGVLASFEEKDEDAVRYITEGHAAYGQVDDPWGDAYALNYLGLINWDPEMVAQSEALFRQVNSQWGLAVVSAGQTFFALGEDYERARRLGEQGIAACQEIGIRWGVAMSYEALGFAHLQANDPPAALHSFLEMLHIAIDTHLARYMANAAVGIGMALSTLGNDALALEFLAAADRYYENLGRRPAYLPLDDFVPPALHDRMATRSAAVLDPVEHIKTQIDALAEYIAGLGPSAPAGSGSDLLTERETEVLGLAADGMSNRAIAEELILSTGTVKWYLSQIYSKLGVSSRTQAIARARELGMLA